MGPRPHLLVAHRHSRGASSRVVPRPSVQGPTRSRGRLKAWSCIGIIQDRSLPAPAHQVDQGLHFSVALHPIHGALRQQQQQWWLHRRHKRFWRHLRKFLRRPLEPRLQARGSALLYFYQSAGQQAWTHHCFGLLQQTLRIRLGWCLWIRWQTPSLLSTCHSDSFSPQRHRTRSNRNSHQTLVGSGCLHLILRRKGCNRSTVCHAVLRSVRHYRGYAQWNFRCSCPPWCDAAALQPGTLQDRARR